MVRRIVGHIRAIYRPANRQAQPELGGEFRLRRILNDPGAICQILRLERLENSCSRRFSGYRFHGIALMGHV